MGKVTGAAQVTHSSEVVEKETSEKLTNKQLLDLLLDTIRDLVELLASSGIRVILIFDKVSNIDVLKPLIPVVNSNNVYTLVVANAEDFTEWQNKSKKMLKLFSKRHFYVPLVWDMPNMLLSQAVRGGLADTYEMHLFRKYLLYQGRGIPQLTKDAITSSLSYEVVRLTGWKRIISLWSSPAQITITQAKWQEVAQYAELQRLLETTSANTFEGVKLWEGTNRYDRTHSALYKLTDWFLDNAKEGRKVSPAMVHQYAQAECAMPFMDESTSKTIFSQFLDCLLQAKKVVVTNKGFDFSGLLVSDPMRKTTE